jgi:hypothetical protein
MVYIKRKKHVSLTSKLRLCGLSMSAAAPPVTATTTNRKHTAMSQPMSASDRVGHTASSRQSIVGIE